MAGSDLFEGRVEGEKFFSHNLQKLEEGQYRLAGTLVAISIAQDGPGLQIINESLFGLMVGQNTDLTDFNLNLLPDRDTSSILEKLKAAADDGKKDAVLSQHGEWLLEQGLTNVWRLTVGQRHVAVSQIVKQLIFYRTSAEIGQFVQGLRAYGLWDMVVETPMQWKPLFCWKPQPLTKSDFMNLCVIDNSPDGSNRRQCEGETIYSWEVFLQDVEEHELDTTFEAILVFLTGADQVPPAGFHKEITIQFFDVEGNTGRLPYSSTCGLELNLPRGIGNPELLKTMMMRMLQESPGFGKC